MGYDVGFIKDEYGCNSSKCECAHYDDIVIGKLFFLDVLTNLHSGDIAVSGNTVHKFTKMSNDSNAAILKAYPDSKVDLWDQNLLNGEYVIAYEFSPGLDRKLQKMLPKVSFVLFLIFFDVCRYIIFIGHGIYIAIISNEPVNLISVKF